jgi:hypothetical protein
MAAILGLLHLDLHVPQANSLKDKRRIIKSFKDRTAHRHNVSIAEIDGLDSIRRAGLAVAMVSNERRHIEQSLTHITTAASQHRDMLLIDATTEWL